MVRTVYILNVDAVGFQPLLCDNAQVLDELVNSAKMKNISPSRITISVRFTLLPVGVSEL